MKVGSLVQYIRPNSADSHLIKPSLTAIYTVREFFPKDSKAYPGTMLFASVDCLMLEEIVNEPKYYPASGVWAEDAYCADSFREILPPIANIEETIKEQTLEIELV